MGDAHRRRCRACRRRPLRVRRRGRGRNTTLLPCGTPSPCRHGLVLTVGARVRTVGLDADLVGAKLAGGFHVELEAAVAARLRHAHGRRRRGSTTRRSAPAGATLPATSPNSPIRATRPWTCVVASSALTCPAPISRIDAVRRAAAAPPAAPARPNPRDQRARGVLRGSTCACERPPSPVLRDRLSAQAPPPGADDEGRPGAHSDREAAQGDRLPIATVNDRRVDASCSAIRGACE